MKCKITGLFWNVIIDYENKKTTITEKRIFYDEIVEMQEFDDDFDKDIFQNKHAGKFVIACVKLTSSKLLKWLEANKILNFFPAKKCTVDYDENLDIHNISFCYYQNDSMYDTVYGKMKETGYVMQPNMIIWNDMVDLYKSYQIDCDPSFVLFVDE